ncbi:MULTISPECIES: DUF3617 family protein [unclassified Ectothiorhodospira]|uniref:DUF3617 domain-containing protein n=1 Tax=unclassified Ectothiorhodospira TaxID=2684909 RepID=UPI001EE83FE6|nr:MULTISPECIES: DUF3617 family protein [unclassified Ectothiorhodospira]MCG5514530.1 DUF3617 domain-containing protein [Ectothiorhodospira sp. 9100]MCG5518666.1 DUF3617 domain-containing protein [Ectothiorhodospira sp. 9905]
MRIRPLMLTTAMVLLVPLAAQADELDLQPGQWEFTNVTGVEGDTPFPEQTHTSTECITAEDVARGPDFLQVEDNCEVTNMDMTSTTMTYDMVCTEEGMEVDMRAELQFMGDRLEGQMTANLESPMGPLVMRTEITGERIGDCE